jgi:hypothetical protein
MRHHALCFTLSRYLEGLTAVKEKTRNMDKILVLRLFVVVSFPCHSRVVEFSGRGRRLRVGRGAGVEPVAPGIAEQVEGKHGDHDGERGKDDHVRSVEERFFASLRMTDALNRREDAEAEEAERGDARSTLRLGRAEARPYKAAAGAGYFRLCQ